MVQNLWPFFLLFLAFYENLLVKSVLKWEDPCLVVLDEVHHCDKDHPYNRLISKYHLVLGSAARPKILGLTASPAGHKNSASTMGMLKNLLESLGDVKMAMVENEQAELDKFMSHARLEIRHIEMTQQEVELESELKECLSECGKRLDLLVDWKRYGLPGIAGEMAEGGYNDGQVNVMEMLSILDTMKHMTGMNDGLDILLDFTESFCHALVSLGELGLYYALEHLQKFEVSKAERIDLPCEKLQRSIEKYKIAPSGSQNGNILPNPEMMPVVRGLLDTIKDIDWAQCKGTPTETWPIVLVLVKARKDARYLGDILSKAAELQQLGLRSVSLTGHGKGGGDGMSVNQQKRMIESMKEHNHQVIVATSIAEEGLDLPKCELVIQVDPPSSVKALVQIRGRARKKNSRFVALCRTENQVRSLQNLQERERFMIHAVQTIVEEQKKRNNNLLL